MKYTLPKLPYALDALAPFISRETLEFHHGKHHRTYVTTLNELIADTMFEDMPLEQIIAEAKGAVFNNAAQAWNHSFFWECLAPAGAGHKPDAQLKSAIESAFGSMQDFQRKFTESATKNFGSGWTWLIRRGSGDLDILNTSNADTPIRTGDIPLLTCDVWEHAYYIDYRNERAKYLKGFWNIVNWEFVSQNFDHAMNPVHS